MLTGVLLRLAGLEEGLFAGAEAAAAVEFVGPGADRVEAGAAVEGGRVAVLALPFGGGVGELLVDEESGAVGVDPVAQSGPGVQQGFVGDLDGVAVHGDQPGPDEDVKGGGRGVRVGELFHQGAAAGAAPGRDDALVGHVDEPGQDAPDGLLLGRVQLGEHGLGGAGDGALDAAGPLVPGHGEGGVLALLPGGEEGVRDEGQGAGGGVVGGVGTVHGARFVAQTRVAQEERDQAGFEGDTGEFGGAGDGRAQFRHGHGQQDEQAVGEHRRQFREFEAASGEVGADAEHDDGGVGAGGQLPQDPYEGPSLALVGAEGEEFLELVDQQHRQDRWRATAVRAGRGAPGAGADRVQQGLGVVGQLLCGEVEIAAEDLRRPFEEFLQRMGGGRERDHRPALGAGHREAAGAA